jgi:hypothetical protein
MRQRILVLLVVSLMALGTVATAAYAYTLAEPYCHYRPSYGDYVISYSSKVYWAGGDARWVPVRRLECDLLRLYVREHGDARSGTHFGLDAADYSRLDMIWPVLPMLGPVHASSPPFATRHFLLSYLFATFTFTVSFGRTRWPHVPVVQP